MSGTNINGFMFTTYAVLDEGRMRKRKQGTIINVTSTTGLQVPPFPGEAVYHASKAFEEAFTKRPPRGAWGTQHQSAGAQAGSCGDAFPCAAGGV